MTPSTMGPIRGRVAWVFDEPNFDVDRIIGVANIKESDPDKLAALAMRDFDPTFASSVHRGDVLVGGPNFGYGHPHLPSMTAMRHLGIAAVLAESFAPAYWNSEMALGFPQVPCPGISRACRRGDEAVVDFDRLQIWINGRKTLEIEPYSPRDAQLIALGGILGLLKQRLG